MTERPATTATARPVLLLGSGIGRITSSVELGPLVGDLVPTVPYEGSTTGPSDDELELVIEALDAAGATGPTDVLASGVGGAVALHLALERPDRVHRMALVAAAGAGASVLGAPVVAWSNLLGDVGPPLARLALGERGSAALQAALAAHPDRRSSGPAAAVPADLPVQIRRARVPTLLIWGQQDRVEPADRAFFALRRLPRADLRMFPATGHLVALEHPIVVAGVVARHFAHT